MLFPWVKKSRCFDFMLHGIQVLTEIPVNTETFYVPYCILMGVIPTCHSMFGRSLINGKTMVTVRAFYSGLNMNMNIIHGTKFTSHTLTITLAVATLMEI